MESVPRQSRLGQLLGWCEAAGASDLHLRGGAGIRVRVHGRLASIPGDLGVPPGESELREWWREAFSDALLSRIDERPEVDASCHHGDVRYRVNFSRQRGLPSCSFRVVPRQDVGLAELQLPDSLCDLTQTPRGLLLLTGATGQGKSTTARALLQEINRTTARRILTIEDPIEYVFEDDLSHFEQREVGIDTATFADGIRNAMRQDPDVIFIGEIRDRESIGTALQAAETGHLVITTLHADSAAQAIARIREFHPVDEQDAVGHSLGRNLVGLVCQRLVPNRSGTRTPCLEILRRDAGVAGAIARNELTLLTGIIEAATHAGMHSFDQYLQELLVSGVVDEETALHHAMNPRRLELALRGIQHGTAILRP